MDTGVPASMGRPTKRADPDAESNGKATVRQLLEIPKTTLRHWRLGETPPTETLAER